jgi:nucleotide-binding universal stress UspA family protein
MDVPTGAAAPLPLNCPTGTRAPQGMFPWCPISCAANGRWRQGAKMLKLLVPIDGSECSLRALGHAIELAKARAGMAELILLQVNPDPILYSEIQVYAETERILELQRKQSEALLAPAAEKVRAAGVPCRADIERGDAATVIARQADTLRCGGIVMGTRGMSAIGNLFLGSAATKVVHLANVPVTLVK